MITIGILLDELRHKHGNELGDSIGVEIYDKKGVLVHRIDCNEEEGHSFEVMLNSLNIVLENEYTEDFYNSELPFWGEDDGYVTKPGYVITIEVQ